LSPWALSLEPFSDTLKACATSSAWFCAWRAADPSAGLELRGIFGAYPNARDVTWLQEEPRNMGAWTFVEGRLRALLGPERELRYVGRPELASPAEGWSDAHAAEQHRIIATILEGVVSHAG